MTPNREEQKSQLSAAHRDYKNCLISHALSKINNQASCEDLVQATFIKTWCYLINGGAIKEMRGFLYHVLDQLIIDEYRKRKSISLDKLIEQGMEPNMSMSLELSSISEEKIALASIESLPDKYRKVMRMRYVSDLPIKTISKMTGLSENRVAVQLHRGHKKLKILIEKKNKIITS